MRTVFEYGNVSLHSQYTQSEYFFCDTYHDIKDFFVQFVQKEHRQETKTKVKKALRQVLQRF